MSNTTTDEQIHVPEDAVIEDPVIEDPVIEDPVIEDPVIEDPVIEDPVIEDPVIEDAVIEDPVIEDPVIEDPVIEDAVIEDPVIEDPVIEDPRMNPIPYQITIEYIEPEPNPIVELMKQHSKIALLIGLDYVDFPEIALKTRVQSMNNAKQILINFYGFVEENILVLIEPSRENILSMLNTILGSSCFTNEIIIYYSGYGNGIMKTDLGFCAEPGIIDNLAKQIMPADFAEITQDELMALLNSTCCKTVCIMDMCCYGNEDMLLKWSADVNNLVKVITLCESDSHNTNKNRLIQSMLQDYLQIVFQRA